MSSANKIRYLYNNSKSLSVRALKSIFSTMSLIKIINNIGERGSPCFKPIVTSNKKKKCLYYLTILHMLVLYHITHFTTNTGT